MPTMKLVVPPRFSDLPTALNELACPREQSNVALRIVVPCAFQTKKMLEYFS